MTTIADRITDAAAAEPGALPLLSYLLTDMWAGMVRRGDATLRLPAQAIDVGGVLASRAEEFLDSPSRPGSGAAPPADAQARHRPARRASRCAARPGARNAPRRNGRSPPPRRSSLAAGGDGRARGRRPHRRRGRARGAACGLGRGWRSGCARSANSWCSRARRSAPSGAGATMEPRRPGAADRPRPRPRRGMAAEAVAGFVSAK